MVINMCGSLDASREASRSGHSKRLSQAHESNASEHAANDHEADDTQEDEDGQDAQDFPSYNRARRGVDMLRTVRWLVLCLT